MDAAVGATAHVLVVATGGVKVSSALGRADAQSEG
jgi:hypothetical protein